MRHISYKKGVEFSECPPSLSVDVVGKIAYLRFRRDVETIDLSTGDEQNTAYRATEYVVACDASPGLSARVAASEEVWFEASRLLASEALSGEARDKRDKLLSTSDPRALEDFPQTSAERTAWLEYRQALRGVPEQAGFPFDVTWPEAPGA